MLISGYLNGLKNIRIHVAMLHVKYYLDLDSFNISVFRAKYAKNPAIEIVLNIFTNQEFNFLQFQLSNEELRHYGRN